MTLELNWSQVTFLQGHRIAEDRSWDMAELMGRVSVSAAPTEKGVVCAFARAAIAENHTILSQSQELVVQDQGISRVGFF